MDCSGILSAYVPYPSCDTSRGSQNNLDRISSAQVNSGKINSSLSKKYVRISNHPRNPMPSGCLRHDLHGINWRRSMVFQRRQELGLYCFSRPNLLIKSETTSGINQPHAAAGSVAVPEESLIGKSAIDYTGNGHANNDIEDLRQMMLPSHPKVCKGQLKNGLRYVILPNKVPANRFEAHMEMHVGSVDEEENEQGIAHMIEHVTFLGSKKREQLLTHGARSNAYTDFHHTVFHVHAPVLVPGTTEPMLPRVLDTLHEIAFKPKIVESRIEKERKAILSELQMMNTIEYRVDCQLLQQLHSENLLGYRFPIGLEEQIKKWDVDIIRNFHERWYFPANATLYVVGDIANVENTVQQIEVVFGKVPPGYHHSPERSSMKAGPAAHLQMPKLQNFLIGAGIVDPSPAFSTPSPAKKERHAVRPPVKHEWSSPQSGKKMKPFIFQHELLQTFSLSLFCKKPVQKVRTYADLRDVLMKRIVLSALQFRINNRYKKANPPFIGIELDHSDSGREGCTVSTLTITAEPKDWRGAVNVAVQEVRRLKEFGVTMGELTRYMTAVLKDSEHLAAMVDSVASVDNLDFIMENDALGHTVMDQCQGHECLLTVAQTVTLEDVNTIGASILEYIADFGKPVASVPAAIVACVPTSIHRDGQDDEDFSLAPEEILEALVEGLNEPIIPEPELEVPKELISSAELIKLKAKMKPTFEKTYDEATCISQLKLSNGIRVNYKRSTNEARGGVMRLVVPGGRARETAEASGSVTVGMRTLSEAGSVGTFQREQVELFCVNNLINCVLEADEEFLCMDFHFTLRDGGMRATFELLHMIIEHNVWKEDAFERAKQLFLTYYRAMGKSLERATANRLMCTMLGGEGRFVEPTPQAIQKLSLPVVKDAVLEQLVTEDMEVSIVGDFTEDEIEACILDFLGTVTPSKASPEAEFSERPISILSPASPELRHQTVLLKDTDERACAYIAGAAPNRWGLTADNLDLNISIQPSNQPKGEEALSLLLDKFELATGSDGTIFSKQTRHPLYSCVALTLLSEIINARLFTLVRDTLGLTYDVSFEMSLFDRLKGGWYVISVTSTPAKVKKAVDASLKVLRGLRENPISQRDLDRARRTLMMRHESDSKDNTYWLGLLTHIQSSKVERKDISCIRDRFKLYEAATIEDVYNAYDLLKVDDDSVLTCMGIAGAQMNKDDVEIKDDDASANVGLAGSFGHGRGMSTMTRPTV
ncbi:hypothetical protein KP509_06G019300 [Ceratopteris richardii]|uniref:Uncharacterized protein n=1 Tax=Ceratopteris richardii TaxID=49495 RepID=A0A8T2UDZ7_CERRI|nr:hypothetical protein KP509_06G019300 [Ceratopteris richardii]KAH7434481.1 hypothetical protein KP509_06G019300 [Ceratopteris richardii]KAH7434482.1 hypothetical protein KP509_06G019300 [Ceratopteris richardii]KAH7434483.1 hypothetical protein KP509_06G019300 [Ceratopteris richardii]KAH7434484.1 hypothetical protein KP509_06G019300 [Ceratopteris richardii]